MVSLGDPGWALFAPRVILGAIFIAHGYPKLFKDFQGTAGFLAGLGFIPGRFWALVLGATEFFGGFALLLGFFSRLAAGLLIISMTIATLLKIFKWKVPFTKRKEVGWEWDALILAGLIAIFLLGAGNASLDQTLGWIWG